MTWTLELSREVLEQVYLPVKHLVDLSVFDREPENDSDLIVNFMASKLWRLNNCYTIVDKHGQRRRFRMNLAQHKVYAAHLLHPRMIILKSRQQGISTYWLIHFFDDGILIPDLNIGLMAQGKSESSTLLKRVQLAYDCLLPEYKELIGVYKIKDTVEEQGFTTDSTMFIRTSFRSATLHRLHISEYGKICKTSPDKANEVKTGTLQAIAPGNPVIIESTAEGSNDFKTMWDSSVEEHARCVSRGRELAGKSFLPVFLSWLDDPDCVSTHQEDFTQTHLEYFSKLEEETGRVISLEQRNFWVAQYRELGEAVYQEYPATPDEAFTKINNGAYYAAAYQAHVIRKNRKIANLYDENLPVYVMLDLGLDDTFVINYFQYYAGAFRIIDEYMNAGEGLEHYAKKLLDSPYHILRVYCPHDMSVRELGSNQTREARFHELGIKNTSVLPRSSIADGIEAVRRLIPNLWIDEKCSYLGNCLVNYSRDWNEKMETWSSNPRHDQWSHGADTLRGMALSGVSSITLIEDAQRRRQNTAGVAGGLAF